MVVFVALSVGGLASCGSSQSPKPVLTTAQARAVIGDNAKAYSTAARTLDVAALDPLYEGEFLAALRFHFRMAKAQNQTTYDDSFASSNTSDVYIPRRQAFPAQFLALDTQSRSDGSSQRQITSYVEASPGAPWKEASGAVLPDGVDAPSLALDSKHYVSLLTAGDVHSLKLDPARLSEDLANYLGRYAGAPPSSSVFADGPFTSGEHGLADTRNAVQNAAKVRVVETLTFSADPSPVLAYRTADGGALAIFSVLGHLQFTPARPGDPLVQGPNRQPLLTLIDPGSYASIDYPMMYSFAATIPVATSADLVHVIAGGGGAIDATGVRR